MGNRVDVSHEVIRNRIDDVKRRYEFATYWPRESIRQVVMFLIKGYTLVDWNRYSVTLTSPAKFKGENVEFKIIPEGTVIPKID